MQNACQWRLVTCLVAAISFATHPSVRADGLYWVNANSPAGSLERINADGTARQTLISGLNEPLGLATDLTHEKVVWTDLGANDIRRANLDGSGVQTLVAGLHGPIDVALDVAGGRMYWTEFSGHVVKQANLDGSNPHTLINSSTSLEGIALDLTAGKIYWSDVFGLIQRANLDGTNIQSLLAAGSKVANVDVKVDPAGGKLYWSYDVDFDPMNPMPNSGQIWQSNLDGSSPQLIVSNLNHPLGMAIDHAGARIYWTNTGTGDIRSSNLDGSSPTVFLAGLTNPAGIVVVPEPESIAIAASALTCLAA